MASLAIIVLLVSDIRYKKYSLILKEPFGTAHGTRTSTEGMLVAVSEGGLTGYGECFMPPYYPENQASMTAFFDLVDMKQVFEFDDIEDALNYIANLADGNAGAKAALDIALHDLFGKAAKSSVREYYSREQWTMDGEEQWTMDNGQRTIPDPKNSQESQQNPEPETRNSELAEGAPEPGTRNPELAEGAPKPETRNLKLAKGVPTSFTIGIDTVETMVRKAEAAKEFKTLKIKLNGENDIEVVSSIREITDQELFVDANQAWDDVDEAIMTAHELVELGVGLIEQPFPVGRFEKAGQLRENCEVPVVADEEIQTKDDIARLAQFYDGINIKLMKAGGIREGLSMFEAARNSGLKVLLGCMTESSIGISAAAQLAHLADWCDLDGNLLIKNDTCKAVETIAGRLRLTDAPGIGITDDAGLRQLFESE